MMTDELREAIDSLYRTFARYARLPPPAFQESADQSRWAAVLGSRPLRELGPAELDRFAFKSMTTWGDADDFRHYLPRLFELAATPTAFETTFADGILSYGCYVGQTEVEVLFGKFDSGGWQTWAAAERTAVTAYLRALWRNVCSRPGPFEAAVALCAIGCAGENLAPYLADWQVDRSAGEALRFASFVTAIGAWEDHSPGELGNAFWLNEPRRQVVAWALSGDRSDGLERAFFAFGTDDTTAAALSAAIDQLRLRRRAAGFVE